MLSQVAQLLMLIFQKVILFQLLQVLSIILYKTHINKEK